MPKTDPSKHGQNGHEPRSHRGADTNPPYRLKRRTGNARVLCLVGMRRYKSLAPRLSQKVASLVFQFKIDKFIKVWYATPWVMKVAGKRQAFSQAQQNEIRGALRMASTKQEHRRLTVLLAVITSSRTLSEIAREFEVSESMVNQLIRAYRRDGLPGLRSRQKGGNHRNMNLAEETELLAPFRNRLNRGERVEVAEIHSAYERKLGRAVSKSVVYYVLDRHCWPKKSSQGRRRKNQDCQGSGDDENSN